MSQNYGSNNNKIDVDDVESDSSIDTNQLTDMEREEEQQAVEVPTDSWMKTTNNDKSEDYTP